MSEPLELLYPNWPLYVSLRGERFQVHRVDVKVPEPLFHRGEAFAHYQHPNAVVLGLYYDPPKPEFPPGIGDNIVLGDN